MRRYINILLLGVALASAGCAKTSIIEEHEAEPIRFSAFIDRATTRGEVTTITNVSTLSLDAYLSGSDAWESRPVTQVPKPHIDDATLTIDGDGSISCDVVAKWPDANGNLSFFSYAPKSCSTISIVDPTGSEDVKLEFTAEDQPSAQSDIIFAASKDLNNGNSGSGVSLTYDHILTKIGFSARTRFDYEEPVVLNSIKIRYGDKVRNKGFYTFDNIEGVWSWTLEDSFHPNTVSEELVSDPAGIVLSDDPKAISAEDKFLMLIPQKIEGLTAIIEYTNGYGEHLQASTVIPTCNLFAGRQYNYCLSVFTDELVFEPAVEDPWGDGDNLNITLEIWNEQQLASIGHSDKYPLNANYILMADLDIKNNYGVTWAPIEGYTGMFDGNNKSISNTTNVIFNTINSGGVRDLTIVEPSFTRNNATAAALVATLANGKIENCGVVGGTIESNVILGGVVGLATNSTLSGCYNNCTLNSSSVIGGIVGELRGDTNKIMGCYNSAQISCNDSDQTTHHIGGIVGSLTSGDIISCYNTGIIHIDDRDNSAISSIVGYKSGSVTTTSCYYQVGAACGVDGKSFRELSELNDAVADMNSSITSNGGSSSFAVVGASNIPNLRGESTASYNKVVADNEWPIFGSEDMYSSITTHGASYGVYRLMVNMLYTSRVARSIGTSDARFTSTFDGDGKRITGVTIGSATAATPQGLFAYTGSGAVVQNLSLENFTVNGTISIGAVVGSSVGTTFTNCSVASSNITSSTTSGVCFAGGIVGELSASGTIDDCSMDSGSVKSTTGGYIGGLVGRNNSSTITNSDVASGVFVEGVVSVGGISGDIIGSGVITLSQSAANVKATTTLVGGISGAIHGAAIKVEECKMTGGAVEGDQYVGGIVGFNNSSNVVDCVVSGGSIKGNNCIGGLYGLSRNDSGTPQVSGCEVSNAIISGNGDYIGGAGGQLEGGRMMSCVASATVNGSSYIGGLVGHLINNSLIDNCTSSSTVTGLYDYVGGLAGNLASAKITNSYMTGGEVSGRTYVGGVSGQTAGDMSYEVIKNCSLTAGKVSGVNGVGGILGSCYGGKITTSNMTGGEVLGTSFVGGVIGTSFVNTEFTGCNISGGSVNGADNVGGIFGGVLTPDFTLNIKITNCDATSGAISGVSKVGGIIGSDDNTILAIERCDSRVNVTATTGNVGGIIGQAIKKGSTIKYCTYGTGSVSGVSKCGGIVGQYQEALTQYCKVLDGAVSGTKYVGGIAGNVEYGAQLFCCSNNAHIKGPAAGGSCIGGVAGLAAYYSQTADGTVAAIQGCFNTGYVEAPTANAVGGIIGRGGANSANPVYVRASYNKGVVSGYGNVGGIAGLDNNGGLHIHACYNYSAVLRSNTKDNGGYILGSKCSGAGYINNCAYIHVANDNASGAFGHDSDLNTHTSDNIPALNTYTSSLNQTLTNIFGTPPQDILYEQGNPTASVTPTLAWERTVTW